LTVKIGEILAGKYRLDALIGRGGMGNVFAATDLETQREYALKVVSRLVVDDVLMQRLHREAEAATRIQSDYVPRVVEVNGTDDGETFLVMERLVGEALSARIREHGALPWREVSRIAEDVLRGLIDAHTAGVVHRDLKPSNVFLANKGGRLRAMVLDFGVCKMDGVDTERLTGTGESIGTVAYMAPEQIRGAAKVDERADLYAFGVLVFEMLTGRLPHDGPSQMAILASKLENTAALLRDYARVEMPEGTSELVAKALARSPEDRFASAQELLKAWRALSKTGMVAASSSTHDATHGFAGSSTAALGDLVHDAPTEISRPASLMPSSDPAFLEPHPTQTALTAGAGLRRGGGGRIAVLLAACGLVAGVVVVGVAFIRGPEPAKVAPAASMEAPSPMNDPSAASSLAFDLPEDVPSGTDGGVVRPASRGPHRRPIARPAPPPAPPPTQKGSGPHITTQPRY
jgi:eukaryotic-like serine/threonine-protein kinase